jgi:hypothetical protein
MFKNTTVGRVILEFINQDHSTEKTASTEALDLEDVRQASDSLKKLASLPYHDDAYEATQGIMKVASEILLEAAQNIEESNKRVADLEKFAEIHSIIDEMIDGGIIDKGDIRDKVAELLENEDLGVVKQAMAMVKGRGRVGSFFSDSDDGDEAGGHEKRGMFDGVINA